MEKHIIHKVYLELSTSSVAEAQKLKENIGSFLRSDVFPLLEKQIDVIDDEVPQYAIQLDKINVEITEKGIRLDNELKYKIVEAIEVETQKVIKTIDDDEKTEEGVVKKRKLSYKNEHQLETFIHFLKTGTNPWWSTKSITQLLTPKNFKKLLVTRDFATKVVRVLRDQKVRDRMLHQLTRASIKEVCIAIAKERETLDITEVEVQKIRKRPVVQQQQIWKELLTAIAYQEPIDVVTVIDTVKEAIVLKKQAAKQSQKEKEKITKNKIPSKSQKKEVTSNQTSDQASQQPTIDKAFIEALVNPKQDVKEGQKTSTTTATDADAIIEGEYVQNAGLVLVHPFLKHFFSHCNLLDEQKQLKDPERCAHLLHYIATGKTKQAESDMVFEKFLCNIPIHQSINRNITITKKQKEQVTKLLNAVNENWGALQKSSHALLQNEFLQRLGKIEKNSSGTTIQIEHKAQDILLKKLSWGMGLIRLPWKKEFIYVNW